MVGHLIGDESGGAIGTILTNLTVSGSTFDTNSALTAAGGAIFFHISFDDGEPYVLNVDNSVFKNNTAGAIGGGAIAVFGLNPHLGSRANIATSTFNNNVGGNGGAIYADSIPSSVKNDSFAQNQAWVDGGALFGADLGDALFGITNLDVRPEVDVSHSSFINNSLIGIPPTAPSPAFVFNIFANFGSSTNNQPLASVSSMAPGGGAVAVKFDGNVHISDGTFLTNTAPAGNGGVLLVGGSVGTSGTTIYGMKQGYSAITTSVCQGNSAASGGDTIAVLDPSDLGATPDGVQAVTDGTCSQ